AASSSSYQRNGPGGNPDRWTGSWLRQAQQNRVLVSSALLLTENRPRRERTLTEATRTGGSWRDSQVRRVRSAARYAPSPRESARCGSTPKSRAASCRDDPESRGGAQQIGLPRHELGERALNGFAIDGAATGDSQDSHIRAQVVQNAAPMPTGILIQQRAF